MEEILDRQNFRCRFSDSECPYGIGRLFIVNPSDVKTSSVCTGFAVSANRILTNHHCVSSDEDCRNTYVSIRTRTGALKGHCTNIEFTRADSQIPNQRSVDLTIISIDTLIPPPYFEISAERAETGSAVTAWVVDHVNVIDAMVTKLECNYDSKDASMVLKGCPAISGNSGSPVIANDSGKVVGILWGSNLPPTIDASFPFDLRTSLPAISVATELFPYRSIINDGRSSLR